MSKPNSRASRRTSLRANINSSSSTQFATDYERQQVETYSGRLVAGRYYLRSHSREGSRSGGPGFALGSMPYNTVARSHKPFKFSCTPTTLPQPSTQKISSPVAPIKTEEVESKLNIFQYLGLFHLFVLQCLVMGIKVLYAQLFPAICISVLYPFALISYIICAAGSFLQIAPRITFHTIKPRALYLFVLLLLGIHTSRFLPQVKNTVYSAIFDTNKLIPSNSLKIDETTSEQWFLPQLSELKNDLVASQDRLHEIKILFANHGLDAELVMAEMDIIHSGQVDNLPKRLLNKVFAMYPKLRTLGGSKSWVDARDCAYQKAHQLLKRNPVLSFLEADPQTGSFSFRKFGDMIFELEHDTTPFLSSVGCAIFQAYEKLLSAIWQSDQEKDWQGFMKALKTAVYSAIDDMMTKIVGDRIALDKRPAFIMFVHSQLMIHSPQLAKVPLLAKILGDYFALLATDSLATLLKSPVPQAHISLDHEILPPLYVPLNYFAKPYRARQINFASETLGTYIVRPDTPRFTPPLSETTQIMRRKMDASHALRDSMAPVKSVTPLSLGFLPMLLSLVSPPKKAGALSLRDLLDGKLLNKHFV
ncbi:hypothetical protein L0F63_001800 [Massospora cicadina]|nr:hypothetical protein L0F63_001800 [Massospora cicadina]